MHYWYEKSQDRLLGGAVVISGYSDEAYAAKGCKVCSRGGVMKQSEAGRCNFITFPAVFHSRSPFAQVAAEVMCGCVCMRLFSLVFVLVASVVYSEEVQHLRESKKLSEASGVKEETGKEVTAVGAVSNDVLHDIEGEHEDPEEVGVVIEEQKQKSGKSGKGGAPPAVTPPIPYRPH